MAIAIISDIHGNSSALKAILADIKKRKIKQTYFLGDAISYGPGSKECLDLLENHKIICCVGNHEQRMLHYDSETASPNWSFNGRRHMQFIYRSLDNANLRFIKSMPLKHKIDYNGYKVLLTHYHHHSDGKVEEDYEEFTETSVSRLFDEENCDAVFFGHIHPHGFTSRGRKILITDTGKLYCCVGSSGCVVGNSTFYTLFDIKDNNYIVNRIDVPYNKQELLDNFAKLKDPAELMFKKNFGIEKERK